MGKSVVMDGKVAELLSEVSAFYDVEMISQLINAMLRNYSNNKRPYQETYCRRCDSF